MTIRILAVCGSLQTKSSNLELLRRAVSLAPEGVEVVIYDGLRTLPLFNPDIEESGSVPPEVEHWRRALTASDAVLIACPEYGHSLSGALKNAIDWTIGSGELERKIVGITAAVPGRDRGRRGLQALRQTLGAVSASVVGGEPIVRGPGLDSQLQALVQAVIGEVRARKESS